LERFEELSHGVLLYNDQYDDTYFVTRFLGGLNEDIRSAIALHRPSNVQEASALALLQEEELTHSSRKGTSRDNGKFSSRSFFQTDKPKSASLDKSDKHSTLPSKGEKQASDDKLKALLAYRKKNGLSKEDESQKNKTEFSLTNPVYSDPLQRLYTTDAWAFTR